jgi:hypothetical protein
MAIGQLFNAAVEKVVCLLNQLETVSSDSWPSILRTYPPLSLDSGLAYVPVKQMTHFQSYPIEDCLRS